MASPDLLTRPVVEVEAAPDSQSAPEVTPTPEVRQETPAVSVSEASLCLASLHDLEEDWQIRGVDPHPRYY